MVRRFSSLFFRQSGQDRAAQAAADNAQAGASHLGTRPAVPPNPIQRTDFPRKTVRHVKSSGALLGTLRSLQYNTQPPPPLPTQSARGLGDLQESFWLKDSLQRTTSQLERCSNQLDEIHGSAAEVRRELEGLQVELEVLQRKIQPGAEPTKVEEPRSEPPKPADLRPPSPEPAEFKPVDITPKRPVIAKPSSIQQRIQFFSKIASK